MLSSQQIGGGYLRAARACRLCIVGAALAGGPAAAQQTGALSPFALYAGLGYGHDDNLLRVPEGAPAFDNQLSDSWRQAEWGLVFDKAYRRQKLFAQAKLSKVKFDHFNQLDYDGKDYQAKWNWQLGNRLEGVLGSTYSQTLAPYTDFRSNQRNLRRQRRHFFEGNWRFHPSWRARSAVSRDKYSYELISQSVNNRTEDLVEAGAEYVARTGSTVGLVLRRLEGKYPNRRRIGQLLVNDDYDQDEIKLRASWLATGITNVQVLAGYAKRKQAALGDDTSGFNGRVSATYAPPGKLSYSAAVWRDFAAIESTVVSYTLNRGASVGASWEATAKIKVEANAAYERRAYNPRLVQINRDELRDSLRTASLRATWAPRRAVQLSAALAHQARSGSAFLAIGKFKSNSMMVNASVQF